MKQNQTYAAVRKVPKVAVAIKEDARVVVRQSAWGLSTNASRDIQNPGEVKSGYRAAVKGSLRQGDNGTDLNSLPMDSTMLKLSNGHFETAPLRRHTPSRNAIESSQVDKDVMPRDHVKISPLRAKKDSAFAQWTASTFMTMVKPFTLRSLPTVSRPVASTDSSDASFLVVLLLLAGLTFAFLLVNYASSQLSSSISRRSSTGNQRMSFYRSRARSDGISVSSSPPDRQDNSSSDSSLEGDASQRSRSKPEVQEAPMEPTPRRTRTASCTLPSESSEVGDQSSATPPLDDQRRSSRTSRSRASTSSNVLTVATGRNVTSGRNTGRSPLRSASKPERNHQMDRVA